MAITNLKLLLGKTNNAEDPLLSLLLEQAGDYILDYTNRTVLILALVSIQTSIAVIYYNRLGTEGEQGRAEGGISRTIYGLGKDVPESIQRRLDAWVLSAVIG